MADEPNDSPSRTSFAFARRATLPDHGGDAWRDAGKARGAFGPAQAGQLPEQAPVTANDNGAAGGGKTPERPGGFVLPDPRPSFARPARLRREEDVQAEAGAARPGQMDKQTFLAVRREATAQAHVRDQQKIKSR